MFYDKLDEVMKHFHKTGAFLTVRDGDCVNTMTVSWGFVGYIWNKPHFICVVRPQRYTFEIIENSASFTISVPFGDMSVELRECGAKSGRDVDKSEIIDYVPAKIVGSPVINGCARYFECLVNYKDVLKEVHLPTILKDSWYKGDYHHFYIGEIVEVY
jgi:flavin reductase (DIM6/NTAB) family NADH-FMN oxidoreductase RutF